MITTDQKDDTVLQLNNIYLRSNLGETILNNISLKIAHQDRIGLVGASGAGKSTLLKLFNYLHRPDQGDILFQDTSVNNINPLELRKQIVLVPQESKLLGMTVESALIYPLQLQKLSEREIKHRLSWCLEQCSIPQSWLSRNENELSLGQRQMVAIARALIMYPKVLLLDEPTSSLDAGKSQWLKDKLIELSINQIMTIIVVTHDLEWLKNFAQRIVYLNQGKIQEDLTIDEFNWKIIEDDLRINNIDQDFDNFLKE